MKFVCWSADYDEPPVDDAQEFFDAEEAARAFSENEWDNSAGECGTTQRVLVRGEDRLVRIFEVETDYSVDFYPYEVTP